VVEELWQMLQGDEPEEQCLPEEDDSGDDLISLSVNAVQGIDSTNTVRMMGNIGGKDVVILIDSGSSHNFVSETIASRWRNH
jgi:hypothetical protein